jgi:hypothetical protein
VRGRGIGTSTDRPRWLESFTFTEKMINTQDEEQLMDEQQLMYLSMILGLFLEKSEPACLDKEGAVLIGYHQYILVLLCDKEPVIDGLPYRLAFLTSS